jgi:gliding motility-associated-like protein
LCAGATLTLDATTAGASYQWQDGSTGAAFNVSQQGVYSITVTNSCGTATDNILVSYTAAPTVSLGNDTALCIGATLTLDASYGGATYAWQDSSAAATFTVSSAGTYTVTVTNSCGTVTDNITVSYIPPVMINLGNDTTLCPGATLALNATTPAATYVWQNGSAAATFTVTQAGTYAVTVTTSCGTITDNIQASYIAPVSINLGNDTTICSGATLTLDATTAGAAYVWQDGSIAGTYAVSQAGTYAVSVTTTCNTVTDNITINTGTVSAIELGNDTSLCPGATLTLDATTANATYLWQDGAVTATYSVSQPGIYAVSVTTTCGTVTDDMAVSYETLPTVSLGNDTNLCAGVALTLDATTTGGTYNWQDGATLATYEVTTAGTYAVSVSTNACGAASDTVSITFEDAPTVQLINDTAICAGDVLTLDATTANATYLWQNGSTGATLDVSEAGTFSVAVANECGSATDEVSIQLQDCECYLYMPSAFSPNKNNKNDNYGPIYNPVCNYTDYVFKIFNRWGELVYSTGDIHTMWDGTYKGELAPIDVYAFYVEYLDSEGTEKWKKGSLTLVK